MERYTAYNLTVTYPSVLALALPMELFEWDQTPLHLLSLFPLALHEEQRVSLQL